MTFDLQAEMTCSNPNELPDCLTTPSHTHIGLADQVILSAMVRIYPSIAMILTSTDVYALDFSCVGYGADWTCTWSLSERTPDASCDFTCKGCARIWLRFYAHSRYRKWQAISRNQNLYWCQYVKCKHFEYSIFRHLMHSQSSSIMFSLSPEPFATSAAHVPITLVNSLKDILNVCMGLRQFLDR